MAVGLLQYKSFPLASQYHQVIYIKLFLDTIDHIRLLNLNLCIAQFFYLSICAILLYFSIKLGSCKLALGNLNFPFTLMPGGKEEFLIYPTWPVSEHLVVLFLIYWKSYQFSLPPSSHQTSFSWYLIYQYQFSVLFFLIPFLAMPGKWIPSFPSQS